MKDFIEERFPEDISYGSVGGPVYSTDIVETNGCHEYRNVNWWEGKIKYNVAYGARNKEQFERLLSFFRICKGRAIGFRFKDWTDYKVQKQLIAVGNNQKRHFQLIKSYTTTGTIREIRAIFKPVHDTITLYKNNEVFTDYTIDYTKGRVELSTPLEKGSRLHADFEFDVPMRFDTDQLSANLEDYGVFSCQNLTVTELNLSFLLS